MVIIETEIDTINKTHRKDMKIKTILVEIITKETISNSMKKNLIIVIKNLQERDQEVDLLKENHMEEVVEQEKEKELIHHTNRPSNYN